MTHFSLFSFFPFSSSSSFTFALPPSDGNHNHKSRFIGSGVWRGENLCILFPSFIFYFVLHLLAVLFIKKRECVRRFLYTNSKKNGLPPHDLTTLAELAGTAAEIVVNCGSLGVGGRAGRQTGRRALAQFSSSGKIPQKVSSSIS